MSEKLTPLGSKIIKGTVWTIGTRWSSRVLGLISTIVIARLLTPEDFGIVAVAVSLVGLIESFTDLGVDTALIRHPNPERKHYDTAWTFSILIHVIAAALVAIAGYFSRTLYNDPRYAPVLYAMSVSIALSGCGNIGFINYRRELDFNKDFIANFITQLTGIAVTIWLAFQLRSYWALVFGALTRTITRVSLTYLFSRYRPRFSLAAYHELVGFSFWIMVRSVAIFLTNRADRLILAAFFSPSILGLYTIASELASMAIFEILHPLGRVLLPALSKMQNDKQRFKDNIKKIFNITSTLAMAAGIGLASIAEPALNIIYGYQYIDAAPMLIILSILNLISGFNQPIGQILLVMNKAKSFALIFIFESILTLSVVYWLSTKKFDFEFILYGRLAVSIFIFIRLYYLLKIIQGIGIIDILAAWIRPIFAGAVMYVSLYYCQPFFMQLQEVLSLALSILTGGLIYSAVLLILWLLMHRPHGIEKEIISRLIK